jgi:Spy/CpxP family protein refolding chaperone
MRVWIGIFSAALFAGGTCLGVALQPRLKPPDPVKPAEAAPPRYIDRLSVHRFASELGLSEEQDAQLDQILGDTQRDLEAYYRSVRAAHERSRESVMGILTEEQKKKLDELLSAERQQRAEAEAERSVKTYTKLLELTPEQAAGFRAAAVEAKNKRRDYYGQHRRGDHEQGRVFYRTVRDEQNKAIEKVLTPAQYQQYLSLLELERFER